MDRVDIEVKFATDEAGLLTGYASVFDGEPDSYGDVIEKGAFTKSLAEHKSAGTTPLMLWQHDPSEPIGVWLELREDATGLAVTGRLILETRRGQEAYALLKNGAFNGLSIGFRTRTSERRAGGGRTLQDLELIEISLVSIPAATRARVTSVKTAQAGNPAAMGAAIKRSLTMAVEKKAPAPEAGTEGDDVETRIDALEETVTGIDTRLKSVEEGVGNVAKSADRIERKLNRPGAIDAEKPVAIESKAFENYVRKGREAMGADEVKTLRVSNDAAGGYLAPATFAAEIIKNVVQFSPIRQYARIQTVSSSEVRIPKRTGTMTGAWVGEIAARAATEPAYGQIPLTPFEAACYVDISNALLEDATVDMGNELAIDGAEEFGRLEGAAFINGDGTGKPAGILTDTTVTGFASGTAATLGTSASDTLIKMFYKLAPFYRANAVWGMSSNTLAEIRLLKDTTGRFLWQDGLAPGQPGTLLGRPVAELPDMDDIGANKFPIIIGDLRQGYRIIDRISLSVLRDPFTQATSGITRFHMRRRVGGGVVKGEAIVRLKCATAL